MQDLREKHDLPSEEQLVALLDRLKNTGDERLKKWDVGMLTEWLANVKQLGLGAVAAGVVGGGAWLAQAAMQGGGVAAALAMEIGTGL